MEKINECRELAIEEDIHCSVCNGPPESIWKITMLGITPYGICKPCHVKIRRL